MNPAFSCLCGINLLTMRQRGHYRLRLKCDVAVEEVVTKPLPPPLKDQECGNNLNDDAVYDAAICHCRSSGAIGDGNIPLESAIHSCCFSPLWYANIAGTRSDGQFAIA